MERFIGGRMWMVAQGIKRCNTRARFSEKIRVKPLESRLIADVKSSFRVEEAQVFLFEGHVGSFTSEDFR